MSGMTSERLEELRRIAEAATPGPWEDAIIRWNRDCYPTQASLKRLRKAVTSDDVNLALRAFAAALRENRWKNHPGYTGPERVEVRGQIIDVWGYHTGGWSGNEAIINVLQQSWLFEWLLERYDAGGHFYFNLERLMRLSGQEGGSGDVSTVE